MTEKNIIVFPTPDPSPKLGGDMDTYKQESAKIGGADEPVNRDKILPEPPVGTLDTVEQSTALETSLKK